MILKVHMYVFEYMNSVYEFCETTNMAHAHVYEFIHMTVGVSTKN